MCDASYLCQVERLEREVLAQVALLPHLDEKARGQIPTVEKVRAEFDSWLDEDGTPQVPAGMDPEDALMLRLMGVAKGR